MDGKITEKTAEEKLMNFLDDKKKIKSWPAKKDLKVAALEYLSTKFEEGVFYKEKEVNDIIKEWHTFGDFFLLRRGLIEEGFLIRTRDGSQYWKASENGTCAGL